MKLYQHFKGGLYIVTNLDALNMTNDALHRRGLEHFVTYTCVLTDKDFVRIHPEFHETVEHEGKTGPRFRVITDPADIMPEGGHP